MNKMTEIIFYAKEFSPHSVETTGDQILSSFKIGLQYKLKCEVIDSNVDFYPDVENGISVYRYKIKESVEGAKRKTSTNYSDFSKRAKYYGAQELDWHVKE